MKISLLTPTRLRPQFVERMVKSAYNLANNKYDLEFLFYIDEDDSVSLNELYKLACIYNVRWIQGERITLSEMWNECYKMCYGDIIMHCGDDVIFRTQEWDDYVRQSFHAVRDKILLVYGNDGIQGQNLATHSFLHRNWIDTIGYFLPPYFVSDYNDTWLTDVARKINRLKYIPELYIEHMHYCVGKAEIDSNTRDRLARAMQNDPGSIYQLKEYERADNASKLLKFIKDNK